MKKLIILAISTLLSTQAFATFGFDCESKDKSFTISGATAAMPGNPLIGTVRGKIDGKDFEFDRTHAAGFWNMGNELKIAALDDDFIDLILTLRAKVRFNRFPAKGKVFLPNGVTKKITCIW